MSARCYSFYFEPVLLDVPPKLFFCMIPVESSKGPAVTKHFYPAAPWISRMRQSAGNSWPLLILRTYPGFASAQVMGKNLFTFLVIIRYSMVFVLILWVTFRYLNSKVRFLMHMREMLTDKATIGNEISIWLYSCEYRISKKRITARMFSKWKVVSSMKYHMPYPP